MAGDLPSIQSFFGTCGRNQIPKFPCRLIWTSQMQSRVGNYPSELLPSNSTSWYISSQGIYTFSPGPGNGLDVTPIGGLLSPIVNLLQFDTFLPTVQYSLIFAKTITRINVPHILTAAEIASSKIDVGEYVFEAIAITDQKETIDIQLTQTEKDAAKKRGESEEDAAFRKLFSQGIPDSRNRFGGIDPNRIGIEYRLDGTTKSRLAFALSGSEIKSVSYRDGSSRVLIADLKKLTDRLPLATGSPNPPAGSLQAEKRAPRAGDTVYLTYVGVKEHYMRQTVDMQFTIQAGATAGAAGYPTDVKVVNYRFYSWSLTPETPTSLPTVVSGWRAVESFNVQVNCVAPLNSDLGDLGIGRGNAGTLSFDYMPGNSKASDVLRYINNPSLLPFYQINFSEAFAGSNYHINAGAINSPTKYTQSEWYQRGDFNRYSDQGHAVGHVLFNVHPSALKKRDVDKFGIERFMAVQIEADVKSGLTTYFPFMDDPQLDNPTRGAFDYLSSSNLKFEPIQPLSRYGIANAEIDTGVGGASSIGFNNSGDNVFGLFGFKSNIIRERFEPETRVLVERHFTTGERGDKIVALEGTAGSKNSITCVSDPSRQHAFVFHINNDGFIVLNTFRDGYVREAMRKLTFRPDLPPAPVVDNLDPKTSQFEDLVGYSGMLGDRPGFVPGKTISISAYANQSSYAYKTTSKSLVQSRVSNVADSQIQIVSIQTTESKIVVPLELGYYGKTEIEYALSGDVFVKLMLVFRSGLNIESVVDSVIAPPSDDGDSRFLILDHRWIKGDSLEITGELSGFSVKNVIVTQLNDGQANDFLDGSRPGSIVNKGDIANLQTLTGSLFFKSDTISAAEDDQSNLYVFFNDQLRGISCAASNDFGRTWFYYFGIVEVTNDNDAKHPFIVNSFKTNKCWLFYLLRGKIVCKPIDYGLFRFEDALIIQKLSSDEVSMSKDGQSLRNGPSYAAAGSLSDSDFRSIDTVAIGPTTAFLSHDVGDSLFSAYRNGKGEMKVMWLSPAKDEIGGGLQLQCNFSNDNGISWYDFWEYIENGLSRLRKDPDRKTQFIDRTESPEEVSNIDATDPMLVDELAEFGVNLHWSHLLRDKINEGETNPDAESKVLEIQSPYVFYQSTTDKVFVFYVYKECLLCKIFGEQVFKTAARKKDIDGGMNYVKSIIETQTRAWFVDGNLTDETTREEIHGYINPETNKKTENGNIIFVSKFGINQYDGTRSVTAQRICAYDVSNGNVRVFYQHSGKQGISAAIWNGTQWFNEDMMHDPSTIAEITQL